MIDHDSLNPLMASNDRDEEVRILTSLGLSKYNPKRVTIRDPPIRVEEEDYFIDEGGSGGVAGETISVEDIQEGDSDQEIS